MRIGFLFRRLSFRIAVFSFLMLVIPIGIALFFFADSLNADFRNTMLRRLAEKLELKADRSGFLLKIVTADVEMCAHEFQEVIDKNGPRTDLVRVMEGLLKRNDGYLSVIFIGPGGRETARVDRAGSGSREAVRVDPHGGPQKRYFTEWMEDAQGGVRFSPMEPAAEEGDLSRRAEVIHSGKRVTRRGRTEGVLAVKVRGDYFFNERAAEKGTGFLVFSERGNYLHHWKGPMPFGEESGHGVNIFKELPVLERNIKLRNSSIYYDPLLREFRIWKKVFYDGYDKSRFWVFMERHPESAIIPSWLIIVRTEIVVFSAIILSAFLVTVLFVHRTLTPLKTLVLALKKIEQGERGVHVALRSNTEIGEITSSFNTMAEKLEKSDREFRYMMEMERVISAIAPNAHIIIDRKGTIISINPFAEKVFGYASTELVGQNVNVLVPSPHKERHDGYLRNYLTTGVRKLIGKSLEVEAEKKDGTTFPIKLYVDEAKVGDDRIFVGIIEDITELKKTMAKLVRANREIVSFANIVSHDLRSPLVNLKGFSHELREISNEIGRILSESPSFPEHQKRRLDELLRGEMPEALGFIDSSTDAMERLTSNILRLARIGTRQLNIVEVDVNRLVSERLRLMNYQIESRSITVTVGDLPSVRADKSAMEQIFANILANAVNYLRHDCAGTIEIYGERRESDTLFGVRDNGRGIAEEDRQKVFELFRRAGKQDVPGEGMGLSYVKTLVERHEGELWFDSELDSGTTFYFTISHAVRPATEVMNDGNA